MLCCSAIIYNQVQVHFISANLESERLWCQWWENTEQTSQLKPWHWTQSQLLNGLPTSPHFIFYILFLLTAGWEWAEVVDTRHVDVVGHVSTRDATCCGWWPWCGHWYNIGASIHWPLGVATSQRSRSRSLCHGSTASQLWSIYCQVSSIRASVHHPAQFSNSKIVKLKLLV